MKDGTMKTDAGIIAAMEEECEGLISRMSGREETRIGPFTYHTGTLEGRRICLLKCGIGKVNAAVGTAMMIERWNPGYMINTGVAGGFSENLKVGDIVLSDKVIHHDADAVVFGYVPGQIPGMPEHYEGDHALLSHAASLTPADPSVHLIPDLIASGDSFIHRDEQIEQIRKRHPDVAAVEMEAAGIAQACHLFEIPFLIIRSLSDVVGDTDNQLTYDEFLPLAARNSMDMVLKILRTFNPADKG